MTGDKEFNDVIEYILFYRICPTTKFPKREELKGIKDYVYSIKETGEPTTIKIESKKVLVFTPDKYTVKKISPHADLFKKISIRGSIREKNSSGRFYVKHLEELRSKFPPNTLFKVPDIGDDKYDSRYFYLPESDKKNGGYYQGKPTSSDITQKPYPNYFDFQEKYNNVSPEGGVSFRNAKKPEALLKFLIELFTKENEIVLDYHLGSGTTCAVSHKINRQYIGIEQLDYGENDCIVRLQNVLTSDPSGISESVNWQGGGDFIYCELMRYNQVFMDKIQFAQSSKELLNLWQDISKHSFLNWYVNPEIPEDAINDFIDIGKGEDGLDKQKHRLAELLNKNQLYVNLSEIDDKNFDVNEKDKTLNREFYGDSAQL